MNLEEIRKHWTDWSQRYGANLRATTKASTAKILEIDAFERRIESVMAHEPVRNVLEVGCGNGINLIELAKRFPELRFQGFDLIDGMIDAARQNAASASVDDRVTFSVGNVMRPANAECVSPPYDVILSNRCLINLNTVELQIRAIAGLAELLRPGGFLLMIENSAQTHSRQNDLRQMLGLERRKPAEFNCFFDETAIREALPECGLQLLDVEDFISLHDLVLYVLLPAVNGGEVDYENPLVAKAAELNAKMSAAYPGMGGDFGQNRLFVCQRRKN